MFFMEQIQWPEELSSDEPSSCHGSYTAHILVRIEGKRLQWFKYNRPSPRGAVLTPSSSAVLKNHYESLKVSKSQSPTTGKKTLIKLWFQETFSQCKDVSPTAHRTWRMLVWMWVWMVVCLSPPSPGDCWYWHQVNEWMTVVILHFSKPVDWQWNSSVTAVTFSH